MPDYMKIGAILRLKLTDILIRLLRLEPADFPKATLTKEEEDGLMSQMWQNPAFRKRVADRDAKLIYHMAGGEGMHAEPRDAYVTHTGQRVENLLWARDAKAAYQRVENRRKQQQSALAKPREAPESTPA